MLLTVADIILLTVVSSVFARHFEVSRILQHTANTVGRYDYSAIGYCVNQIQSDRFQSDRSCPY